MEVFLYSQNKKTNKYIITYLSTYLTQDTILEF